MTPETLSSISQMMNPATALNEAGDFWFNDHGNTVFKLEGDNVGDYGSFLWHRCHKPSECVFNAEDGATLQLPIPGESKKWPCGCKFVAVSIPQDSTIEGVGQIMKEAYQRMRED